MGLTSAKFAMTLDAIEALTLGMDLANNPSVTHTITTGASGTLTPAGAPPASKVWSDNIVLVAGAATIDLTALDGPLSSTVDFTGLKVQAVKIVADADNTERLLFAVGASNGYSLFGAATCELSLGPGESVMLLYKDTLADVAAGAKEIDVTSAEATAGFSIILIAG